MILAQADFSSLHDSCHHHDVESERIERIFFLFDIINYNNYEHTREVKTILPGA